MLSLERVSYQSPQGFLLQDIDFRLQQGTVLAVMGASGSGKSTLLKLIYGLLDANEGKLNWKNEPIVGPKHKLVPGMEFCKMVSQHFDLMPYSTVSENVGKFLSNFYPEEKQNRVKELLKQFGLLELSQTKVQFLSGGQQQRVALAQALAHKPAILLLDEPFNQIDTHLKFAIRSALFSFCKSQEITVIMATHEAQDTLGYAEKVVMLQNGKQISFNNTMITYLNPVSLYAASLLGIVNQFTIDNAVKYLRPHQIIFVEKSDWEVTVVASIFAGHFYTIEVNFNGKKLYLYNDEPLINNTKKYIALNL